MDFKSIADILQTRTDANAQSPDADYEGYQQNIEHALLYFIDAMFPAYTKCPERPHHGDDVRTHYLRLAYDQLCDALEKDMDPQEAARIAGALVERIPDIYEKLQTDVIAGYRGDPAAKSVDEVILCYPAFTAISTYRIAHELYLMDQLVVARMMSEYAHRKTGIDIHPGATIGKYFFIDHGTGVVIGETCEIGENVKLYQHVTLGAKSFAVAEDGSLVKGIKRHPNIGNDVVIYAGATILGGDVFIGDGCVIGGNVWLTHSVEAGQTVTQRKSEQTRK